MEDLQIIELYWQRQEAAIEATAQKYGDFLFGLAWNILHCRGDADECVNDTYLKAWNAIPPQRPSAFRVWLGCITRNLSLDRWRQIRSEKRGGEEMDLLLGELDGCVPDGRGVEQTLEDREIAAAISRFLRTQSQTNRAIFLRRYWYGQSLRDIAITLGCSEGMVKSSLFRSRGALRAFLEKEGIAL